MAGDDLRRAAETFDQQAMHAVVLNTAMNTTSALEHGQRMNRFAGAVSAQGQAAAGAGIGLAAVALKVRNDQIGDLRGQLGNAWSSGNASNEASRAGGVALTEACREIARLSGESLDAVQARYNRIRTQAFVSGVRLSIAQGSVLPQTLQEFSKVSWIDKAEMEAAGLKL